MRGLPATAGDTAQLYAYAAKHSTKNIHHNDSQVRKALAQQQRQQQQIPWIPQLLLVLLFNTILQQQLQQQQQACENWDAPIFGTHWQMGGG